VPVILSDIFGDPNVGIFSFANEKIAVLPAGTSAVKLASFKEALGVEAYGIGIADSRLVGIYLSGNSNSILLPYIATNEEMSKLRSTGVRVTVIEEKRTALGNIILCNDYGAIVDPRLKPRTVSEIEQALKVPAKPGTIGGLPQIGSLATASNKGVLANPIIEESEKKLRNTVPKIRNRRKLKRRRSGLTHARRRTSSCQQRLRDGLGGSDNSPGHRHVHESLSCPLDFEDYCLSHRFRFLYHRFTWRPLRPRLGLGTVEPQPSPPGQIHRCRHISVHYYSTVATPKLTS